ncbi:6-phosphogluconate dehydrogenase C-terminal domain-like protein [Phanerochaete sordida]|uniref:phosphogluconate dehydrogenase (NADP(+)-dependent, decarboxylating) n=1 Tax=Phanerochaete sordida TaxID=48140 RepID=A0A9P3GBU9_9APHY|nr:6-phosphogluconate dehydrogenase C-terminal domain-like protein [Phanerochaete sordida]
MSTTKYTKIGIVGAGSMGSMMCLLFAEAGPDISVFDVKGENVDTAVEMAEKNPKTQGKVKGYKDYESFVVSLPAPGHRLLLFSITHGQPADAVLDALRPHLARGDIILDGGNEWYANTERRQARLAREQGVAYVGMGVSGGYQSARHGPSLTPGGDPAALRRVLPLLEAVAAKDARGTPCVAPVGPGGSGHYVKMVHNGIEQGMLGAIAEVWGLLRFNLGCELDEIGEIFKQWSETPELKKTFLLDIGVDICQKRDPSVGQAGVSDNDHHVLSTVLDKVVQDADDTEGTGMWTVAEAARLHISAPTIAASHFLRLASADRAARLKIGESLKLPPPPVGPRTTLSAQDKALFVEELRQALYAACLAAFTQGLQLIARQSDREGWGVSLATCLKVWRAGCIIASDRLLDAFAPVAADFDAARTANAADGAPGSATSAPRDAAATLPAHPRLGAALAHAFPGLRAAVLWALARDAHVPTLGAALEWAKCAGAGALPTMFMEAQLDWFGAHRFERWGSDAARFGGEVRKGGAHYEWAPA